MVGVGPSDVATGMGSAASAAVIASGRCSDFATDAPPTTFIALPEPSSVISMPAVPDFTTKS